jgi:hypothetical protein
VGLSEKEQGWLAELAIWLIMVVAISPVLVAWHLWEPLDALPYLLCFAAGALFGVLGFWLWGLVTRRKVQGCLPLMLFCWAPLWAVGVGLGSNVLLDRSPLARHDTTFLGYDHPLQGPMRARFASWRKRGSQEDFRCGMLRMEHCFDMARGQPVTVITHRGALGWEWIDDFAVRR